MASRAMRAKRDKHTRAPLFVVLAILISLVSVIVAGVIGVVHLCDEWTEDLPDPSTLTSYMTSSKTRIYAADHTTLLAELYLEQREPVSYDQVSPYLYDATVAVEDSRFYEHNGVDMQGIGRALVVNLKSGSTSEGASTITQQLVRNTLLSDEMSDISFRRKVREADLAMQVEKIYSKDEILNMYCNVINYGDGCYGVQAAAQNYFGIDAKDLDLSQAALLAGIPNSPTRFNPYNNYDASIERRNLVLQRMLDNGYITQDQFDQATAEQITLADHSSTPTNGVYQQPYFVDYVKGVLEEKYSTSEIFKGGLTVYTTLDMDLQAKAETACSEGIDGEADDVEAALLSINPTNGYIVAMVGGKDYNADQYNLATQASRQCGSSFKAITLATAIEAGMSPDTLFNGTSPMQVTSNWKVTNDDNASYSSLSIQNATDLSVNTVYAQLAVQMTPDAIIDMAHRLGVTTELESVPSITLGTQGVTVLEMADAYATFADGGVHHDPVCITQILDNTGQVIYQDPATSTQAITPEVAYATTKVLATTITNGTASPAKLSSSQVQAGKTGTTQNYRDAYFVGYTPQLSTAVWVGTRIERDDIYVNGEKLHGSTACCPIWKTYMDAALENYQQEGWITADTPDYTLDNTSTFRPYEEQVETTTTTTTTDNNSTDNTNNTTTGNTGTGDNTNTSTGGDTTNNNTSNTPTTTP